MKSVEKPAIVREAENPELGILASEINKAAKEAEASAVANVKQFRNIGLKLIEAKKKVGHGKWTEWAKKKLEVTDRQMQRWIRLAKTDVPTSDLTEAWKVINGNYDEDDDEDRLPTALKPSGQEDWCSRCIRLGTQTFDCAACDELARAAGKKKRKPKAEKKVPDPIRYDEKKLWQCANRFAHQVDAFAHEKKLKEDELYAKAKKHIDQAKEAFKKLEAKATAA